jgi:hypothetical protein
MKNAKTTIAGILTIVLPILGMLLKWLNGDPITASDFAMLSASASSGTGLWFAKDAATPSTTVTQKVDPVGPVTISKTL